MTVRHPFDMSVPFQLHCLHVLQYAFHASSALISSLCILSLRVGPNTFDQTETHFSRLDLALYIFDVNVHASQP